MARPHFHEELEQMELQLLTLGELAGSAVRRSVDAVVQHDDALAEAHDADTGGPSGLCRALPRLAHFREEAVSESGKISMAGWPVPCATIFSPSRLTSSWKPGASS